MDPGLRDPGPQRFGEGRNGHGAFVLGRFDLDGAFDDQGMLRVSGTSRNPGWAK